MTQTRDEAFYEQLRNTYNHGNPFANSVGVSVTSCTDGHAEAEVILEDKHINTISSVHGGVAYVLADTVTGCASRTRGQTSTTIEGKLNYLRAATAADRKLIGTADVVHFGRKTIVLRTDIRTEGGRLIATGLFTYFVIS